MDDVLLGGFVQSGKGGSQGLGGIGLVASGHHLFDGFGRLADCFQGLQVNGAALDVLAGSFDSGLSIRHGIVRG